MRKIDLFLAEYRQNHKNKINKLIHWICIPIIFWSVLGFISLIPSPHMCSPYFGCISIVSSIALLLIMTFYIRLSLMISCIIGVLMILMEYCIYRVNIYHPHSWTIYLSVFLASSILQLAGHSIEGQKIPLLKRTRYLFIGSIWLLSFPLKKIGIRY